MRVSVGHRLVNLGTTLAFVMATIWPSYSFATQTQIALQEDVGMETTQAAAPTVSQTVTLSPSPLPDENKGSVLSIQYTLKGIHLSAWRQDETGAYKDLGYLINAPLLQHGFLPKTFQPWISEEDPTQVVGFHYTLPQGGVLTVRWDGTTILSSIPQAACYDKNPLKLVTNRPLYLKNILHKTLNLRTQSPEVVFEGKNRLQSFKLSASATAKESHVLVAKGADVKVSQETTLDESMPMVCGGIFKTGQLQHTDNEITVTEDGKLKVDAGSVAKIKNQGELTLGKGQTQWGEITNTGVVKALEGQHTIRRLLNSAEVFLNGVHLVDAPEPSLKNWVAISEWEGQKHIVSPDGFTYARSEHPKGFSVQGSMTLDAQKCGIRQLSDLLGFDVTQKLSLSLGDVVQREKLCLKYIGQLDLTATSLDVQDDIELSSGNFDIENSCKIGLGPGQLRKLRTRQGPLHIRSGSFDGRYAQVSSWGPLSIRTTRGKLLLGDLVSIPYNGSLDSCGVRLGALYLGNWRSPSETTPYYAQNGAYCISGGTLDLDAADAADLRGVKIFSQGFMSVSATTALNLMVATLLSQSSGVLKAGGIQIKRMPHVLSRSYRYSSYYTNAQGYMVTSDGSILNFVGDLDLQTPDLTIEASTLKAGRNLTRNGIEWKESQQIKELKSNFLSQTYLSQPLINVFQAGQAIMLNLGKDFMVEFDSVARKLWVIGKSGWFVNKGARVQHGPTSAFLINLPEWIEKSALGRFLLTKGPQDILHPEVPMGQFNVNPASALIVGHPQHMMPPANLINPLTFVDPSLWVQDVFHHHWNQITIPDLGDLPLLTKLLQNTERVLKQHKGPMTEEELRKITDPLIYFTLKNLGARVQAIVPHLYLPARDEGYETGGVHRAGEIEVETEKDVGFKNVLLDAEKKLDVTSKGNQHWITEPTTHKHAKGSYQEVLARTEGRCKEGDVKTKAGPLFHTQAATFKAGQHIHHKAEKIVDSALEVRRHHEEKRHGKLVIKDDLTHEVTKREAGGKSIKEAPEVIEEGTQEKANMGFEYPTAKQVNLLSVKDWHNVCTLKNRKNLLFQTHGAKGEERTCVKVCHKESAEGKIVFEPDAAVYLEKKLGEPIDPLIWAALKDHPNVTIEEIAEIHHVWKQKTVRGLSGPAMMLLTTILTIATQGWAAPLFQGMQASVAAMCATGLEALSVNFAVQTANHMGRLDKAFKAVTTPEALTDLAITAITAGAFQETTKHLKLPAQPKGLEAIAKNQFFRARIEMDVRILFGEKPKTAAKKAFKAAGVNTVSSFLSQNIGQAYQRNLLDDNNNNNPHNVVDNTSFELPPLSYAGHKFAHFWAGVLAGGLSTIGESKKKLFQNMWVAGAAETFSEMLCDISHKSPQELYQEVAADIKDSGHELTPETYRQGLEDYAQRRANIAQMLTVSAAFLMKQDINLAYTTARIATQENAMPFIVAVGLYALATAGAVHSGLEIKKAYDQDGTPGALKQGAIEATQYAAGYAAGKAIAIVGKPVAGYLMAKWGDQILLISDKTWQLFKQMNPALAFQVERAAVSGKNGWNALDQKTAQWLQKAALKLEQKGSAAVERTAISPVGNKTGVSEATTVVTKGERSATRSTETNSSLASSPSVKLTKTTQNLLGMTEKAYKPELFERAGKLKHETSLIAAKIELEGGKIPIAKLRNRDYDHPTKVKNAQNGLYELIEKINNRLGYPKLPAHERVLLQEELAKASKLLDYTKKFIPRK